VKQQLTMLRHASGPAQEHAGKLFGGRVPLACHGLTEYFRDVYDHLARINQAIDAGARDGEYRHPGGAGDGQHGSIGEITKRLAAYAALVAVPTMIAGVYGMNFEVMPELKWTFGYPLSIAAMAVIDGILFFRFRKGRLDLA
jgi:magnesium transporter